MTQNYDDLERKALDGLDTIRRTASDHSRIIIGTLAIAFLLSFAGVINPSVPDWWPLILAMAGAGVGVGFIAAIGVYQLIPEKEGILLVSLRGNEPGGEIWEVYEDTWEDMDTDGTLYEWSESSRRVYEVRDYDAESNQAIANWREAEPASSILDSRTVEDAIAQISELREVYEPEAQRARRLQRRIRGIVRRMDQERTEARARQLDEATGLEAMDGPAIAEILDDELPQDLHPEAGGGDNEETKKNGNSEKVDIDLSEDEPLEINEYADPQEVGL